MLYKCFKMIYRAILCENLTNLEINLHTNRAKYSPQTVLFLYSLHKKPCEEHTSRECAIYTKL